MTSLCPKPCSGLATAAIIMIIGVIQLLAGVILLRSGSADLISGPNFIGGSSNIVVGCIYGTVSSIWNSNTRKKSSKVTARKNILAALLLSVITVNVTAAIILIMGDGSRLLNLYLEKTDFASEILAYAFITSVCSPIICIVIALVILSGRFIEICRDIKSDKSKNSIAKDDSYNWVFDPKTNDNVKVICDIVETSSESTSASEDSVFTEEDKPCSRRKSVLSVKNIPSPLNMWKEKRQKLLNDADWSLERSRMDLVLEKPNFYERLIPRIKQSSLRRDLNPNLGDLGKKSGKSFKSILKRSSSSPDSRGALFHTSNPTNELSQTRCKYVHGQISEENQENRLPEYLRASKQTTSNRNKPNKFMQTKGKSLNHKETADWEEVHFVDPIISELKAETLKELKQKVAKILPGGSFAVIKLPDNCKEQDCMSASDNSDEPLRDKIDSDEKPHCSDISRYKLFTNCSESSNSSGRQLLSDITPESVHQASYSSENSPYEQSVYKNKGMKTGFSKIRSKSFDNLNEEPPLQNRGEREFSSSKVVDEKKNYNLNSQRVSSLKQQNRKFDTSRKMSMASIAEIPLEEDYYSEINSVCSGSDFGENPQRTDENSNIRVKEPSRKHNRLMKASRRKSSLTSNKLLKRMWSSSEPKINVSDMIVDEDSLIGLSEEELLARTFRLRSLRKTVEDRLKTKKEAEKQVATNSYSSAL